jgi:hypothetical protein
MSGVVVWDGVVFRVGVFDPAVTQLAFPPLRVRCLGWVPDAAFVGHVRLPWGGWAAREITSEPSLKVCGLRFTFADGRISWSPHVDA